MEKKVVLVDYDDGVITIAHRGGDKYSFSPPCVCFTKMVDNVEVSTWLPNISSNKHTGLETNGFYDFYINQAPTGEIELTVHHTDVVLETLSGANGLYLSGEFVRWLKYLSDTQDEINSVG